MQAIIHPGARIEGRLRVPGDKSIAHRWLILATTAGGRSALRGLPQALDVRSTASCLAAISGRNAAMQLSRWAGNPRSNGEDHRFTWDPNSPDFAKTELVVEGEGWAGLQAPGVSLDCENSGTTMRLLMGALAGRDFDSTLVGDEALSGRPMERVASPLRRMGAEVTTEDGHAPVRIQGGPLHGERLELETPSSQVKSALLLAGLTADGTTTVAGSEGTQDHTERALQALGAPVSALGSPEVSLSAFQHGGFEGDLPGDPSSAVFPIAAAALTGGSVEIAGVGRNESRIHYESVLSRMGVVVKPGNAGSQQLGEATGDVRVEGDASVGPVTVGGDELPSLVDDVLMLAVLAAFAPRGEESRFEGAGELRLKESDRLAGLADGIEGLGGAARVDGDALVVAGGGLEGGSADARRDHRLAMAFTVGALAARRECRVDGIEWADVSFPGFVPALRALGAEIEVA